MALNENIFTFGKMVQVFWVSNAAPYVDWVSRMWYWSRFMELLFHCLELHVVWIENELRWCAATRASLIAEYWEIRT